MVSQMARSKNDRREHRLMYVVEVHVHGDYRLMDAHFGELPVIFSARGRPVG